MGRPKKPLQRRPNGIWCVQLWIDGKRRVKSLETRDPVKAAARAQQAMQELEAEAATARGESRWRADTAVTEWDIPTLPDGRNDYAQAVAKQKTWGKVAANDDLIKQTDWLELVREAEGVLKRKHKKTYSASWHRNVGIAIKQCPFTLQEASPTTIRGMDQDDGRGWAQWPDHQQQVLLALWVGAHLHQVRTPSWTLEPIRLGGLRSRRGQSHPTCRGAGLQRIEGTGPNSVEETAHPDPHSDLHGVSDLRGEETQGGRLRP
ncbi:hypothetical protein [Synechococcus sp. CC9311]|uniref:hypothetical protein n=1 Tax=Synechococcus sp. (strain CC9311) TaxID=64471 RepID=UPI00059E2FA2|nr:hypothetical protein [Synechococcus sp. CC9311]